MKSFQLPAVEDLEVNARPAVASALLLESAQQVFLILAYFPEHAMVSVQPGRLHEGDEELRPVRVGSRVRHRKQTRLVVLELEVLVREGAPVNGHPACAVPVSEVAPLRHEIRDNPVEEAALVSEALLVSDTQRSEVLRRLRTMIGVELSLTRPSPRRPSYPATWSLPAWLFRNRPWGSWDWSS